MGTERAALDCSLRDGLCPVVRHEAERCWLGLLMVAPVGPVGVTVGRAADMADEVEAGVEGPAAVATGRLRSLRLPLVHSPTHGG